MPKKELTPQEKRKLTISKKKEAERIRQLFITLDNVNRVKWAEAEQKAYDFHNNDQLSKEEQDMLEMAGMPSFIINRITPVVETMKYFVTANRPKWKAVGKDGSDSKIAEIHTDVIDHSWYLSGGQSMLGRVVLNTLVKSKGYVLIYVDPNADRGMGEVMFTDVDPFDVYVDPASRDPFERDASIHMIKKDMPRQKLTKLLPEYKDVIARADGEADNPYYSYRDYNTSHSIQPQDITHAPDKLGADDDYLQYYEVYEPEKQLFYNVFIKEEPSDAELMEAKRMVRADVTEFAKELKVRLMEKQAQLEQQLLNGEIIKARFDRDMEVARVQMQEAIQEREANFVNKIKEEATKIVQHVFSEEEYEAYPDKQSIDRKFSYYETRYKKTVVVGNMTLYSEELPCKFSPLIAIPYSHTGTPFPMSAVRPLIGKQREINKAHQIMIHNANLSSNLRWMYEEGSIDAKAWMMSSTAPNALLPYHPGATPPIPVLPQNINNAFFTIEQDSKTDIEYMAGIQPPSMGISQGSSDETFRGFLAKDEHGTRRIRSWVANVLEPALEHMGCVYEQFSQDTYSIHKIFRLVQPIESGGVEEREVEINTPIYDDMGNEVGRYNDYNTNRYDIRIVAGSTLPVNRWAIMEEYKQYLELGVIDDIAFLAETDIRDKDNILKRKSMLSQLQGQLEQMEEAIKDRDGTIETLSRQLVQAGIKEDIMSAQMEVDRSKTETKMIDKLTQERIRDSLKSSRAELDLVIEKVLLELQKQKNKSDGTSNKSEK